MYESHAHLNITSQEWNQTIKLFMGVLAKHQVPEQESQELLDIVASTQDDMVTAGKQ